MSSSKAGSESTVRVIIESKNAELVRWYREGDVRSVADCFAADAWQMPPNAAPLIGREALSAFWSQAVQWGTWNFTLKTERVDVDGSIAVERGKYRLGFVAGPGAPKRMLSFDDWGNYLVHWRREPDGVWRIVADAPVSERPTPGG
jgi:ketosteroid isomerase-like protein